MKYTTVTVSGVIISIGKTTGVRGYTETLLESFLPDEKEIDEKGEGWTDNWIKENNKRMTAICKFLNANKL